jgi:transcriptional regulator with XRE-family HTH domain
MARSLHTAAHRELVAAVTALRKAAGLTQRELAARLGREQNFVARLETGGRRLDLIELIAVCAACDTDPRSEIASLVTRVVPLLPKLSRGLQRAAKRPPGSTGRKAVNR